MSLHELPIYRNFKDETGLPIAKVGVREIRTPIILRTKAGNLVQAVGNWSIYTDLSEPMKGVSMSLMQRTLFASLGHGVSTDVLIDIAKQIYEASEHQSKDVYVKVNFPYAIAVKSPISQIDATKFYDCSIEVINSGGVIKKYLTVTVQYIATCSCSKKLAEELFEKEKQRSSPHQQRGYAKVTVEYDKTIWIEDLVLQIEDAVKAVPYPVIRRVDEQFICKTAYDNSLIVEEAARAIALKLNENKLILDFVVVCDHQESIHSHDAVAVMRKGVNLK